MKILNAALFVTILTVSHARDQPYGSFCSESDTCLGDTVCDRPEGCTYGICGCPEGQARTTGNSCKDLIKVDEECKENSDCYDGGVTTTCSNKKCQCNDGLSADDEKKKCGKYVGDSCGSNTDCNRGVTMECKNSKCMCKPAYKEDDRMCVPYDLGEDCSDGKMCSAGSCRDNECSCANTLVAYLDRMCIHKDATTDLGKGVECTTIATTGRNGKYCGEDLTCKKCPNQNKLVCQGASAIKSGILLATISVIVAVLQSRC